MVGKGWAMMQFMSKTTHHVISLCVQHLRSRVESDNLPTKAVVGSVLFLPKSTPKPTLSFQLLQLLWCFLL